MNERRIDSGTSCILVKDKGLLKMEKSSLYRWLRKEKFISWGKNGWHSGVDWMYINLSSKVYAPGIPGSCASSVIGNHAVSADEFKLIYNIFKKYEGLDVLRMSQLEQNEWYEKQKEYESENNLYWSKMCFEHYLEEVKNEILNEYTSIPKEEVCEYIKEQSEYIKSMFEQKYRPGVTAYNLYMMW